MNPHIVFPIKQHWLSMIANGTKQEEYREIKPYWETRFKNLWIQLNKPQPFEFIAMFRGGYATTSPYVIAKVELKIKTGNPTWGAIPNETYYTLCIKEIIERNIKL